MLGQHGVYAILAQALPWVCTLCSLKPTHPHQGKNEPERPRRPPCGGLLQGASGPALARALQKDGSILFRWGGGDFQKPHTDEWQWIQPGHSRRMEASFSPAPTKASGRTLNGSRKEDTQRGTSVNSHPSAEGRINPVLGRPRRRRRWLQKP